MGDNRILYIGLILTDQSKELLLNIARRYANMVWNGIECRFICHHMTIAFKTAFTPEIMNWLQQNEGKEYDITVTHFGFSDKALAIMVDTECPSANNIKHITMATNLINHGKPVDSNFITNWNRCQPFHLKGIVQPVYK